MDVLEARAYAASLSGNVEFEKQKWENCVRSFSEARVIYSSLFSFTKQDIFKDILASTIDPMIRYAAYQMKISRTIAIPTIARKFFPSSDGDLVSAVEKLDENALREEQIKGTKGAENFEGLPKTITWRSRTVNLADAAIATALGAVSKASTELSQKLEDSSLTPKEKAAAYDDILIASQDATDATKRAIDELLAEGVGQDDQRIQSLQITRTAVNYALVGWRIGRNRVLMGPKDGSLDETGPEKSRKSKKNGAKLVQKEESTGQKLAKLRERVVLYDSTLQVRTDAPKQP